MCGRTTLTLFAPEIEERFNATFRSTWSPRYNIAPGGPHPAILSTDPGTILRPRWGLIPHWADDPSIGNKLVNARAETVASKPAFRDAFAHRRCLVPVDGYYEWKQLPGGKQPYRITCNGGGGFALAGLWETWEGEDESITSLTVITTEANDTVSEIHHRMPAVLPQDRERDWLSAGVAEAEELLEPAPSEGVHAYPVSTAVNDPSKDSPDVIEEVPAVDQSGLDEFGA